MQILVELILKLRFLFASVLGFDYFQFLENNDITEEENPNNEESTSNETISNNTEINLDTDIEINLDTDNSLNDSKTISFIKKEHIETGFDTAKYTAVGIITAAGSTGFIKAPTIPAKVAIASAAVTLSSATAVGIELFKDKVLDNFDDFTNNRPPSPGQGPFNLVDINPFFIKLQSIINNFDYYDTDSKLIIISIILILLCFFFIIYIFSFVVSFLILDLIKNHLPLTLKTFLLRFININRKLSIPFVIISFIMMVIALFFATLFLSTIIYFKK